MFISEIVICPVLMRFRVAYELLYPRLSFDLVMCWIQSYLIVVYMLHMLFVVLFPSSVVMSVVRLVRLWGAVQADPLLTTSPQGQVSLPSEQGSLLQATHQPRRGQGTAFDGHMFLPFLLHPSYKIVVLPSSN